MTITNSSSVHIIKRVTAPIGLTDTHYYGKVRGAQQRSEKEQHGFTHRTQECLLEPFTRHRNHFHAVQFEQKLLGGYWLRGNWSRTTHETSRHALPWTGSCWYTVYSQACCFISSQKRHCILKKHSCSTHYSMFFPLMRTIYVKLISSVISIICTDGIRSWSTLPGDYTHCV